MSDKSPKLMSWQDWARHDATDLAALVRTKQASPREILAQAAAAIAKLEPTLDAVLEVFDDVIANPDADHPDPAGLLYGVPMLLKDIGSTLAGRRQEVGSRLMRGNVATVTDPAVANFLAAGLIPIGRSTTPEFGMGLDTSTDYLGRPKITRNPFNPAYSAGGSSGGSSAMVAAGALPVGMANDGGGSIRLPAACCGLVGLKASRGRVPRPLNSSEFITRFSMEGVVTRTVRDTAAVFETLTRIPKGGSFIAMGPPRRSYLSAILEPLPKLRIAVSTGAWGQSVPVDPEIADRTHEVAAALAALGHRIEVVDGGEICDWPQLWFAYRTFWVARNRSLYDLARSRGVGEADMPGSFGPLVWKHVDASRRATVAELFRSMDANNIVTRQFGAFLDKYDVLLTPTLAIRTPLANGPYSLLRTDIDLDSYIDLISGACRYMMPHNETGLPGLSVPAGTNSEGLPIGVQFTASFGAEDLLMQIAAELERSCPQLTPPLPSVHVAKV
jgi:amidase